MIVIINSRGCHNTKEKHHQVENFSACDLRPDYYEEGFHWNVTQNT